MHIYRYIYITIYIHRIFQLQYQADKLKKDTKYFYRIFGDIDNTFSIDEMKTLFINATN